MVDREGVFQAVCGHPPVGPESADVVDQHVQPRVRVEHGRGQSADLGLRRQVGDERVHRRVSGLPADGGRGGPGAVVVAAGDADPGAQGGQAIAVALPMPPVPPVIRTVFPAIGADAAAGRRSCPGPGARRLRHWWDGRPGRRWQGRQGGFGSALVEAERRVLVGHQPA